VLVLKHLLLRPVGILSMIVQFSKVCLVLPRYYLLQLLYLLRQFLSVQGFKVQLSFAFSLGTGFCQDIQRLLDPFMFWVLGSFQNLFYLMLIIALKSLTFKTG
jgi:hypothetical protein